MEPSKVALIIPAFNEAEMIATVVEEISSVLGNEVVVYVVDDCSTDATKENASKAGAKVLSNSHNLGYAGAIDRGLRHAAQQDQFRYLITMDADGQHDPQSVKLLIQTLFKTDASVVSGIRSKSPRLGEYLYKCCFQALFGVLDPLCGLKGYKTEFFVECKVFESYDSIGSQLLTRALLKGRRVEQTPVKIRERVDEPRFGSGWKVNIRIIKSLFSTLCFIAKTRLKRGA